MTPTDTATDLAHSTDSTVGKTRRGTEQKGELVSIYGFVSDGSEDYVRLYQGLGVTQFYEIPKREISKVVWGKCGPYSSLTKLVLPGTARITYVSSRTVTLPASALAAAVAAKHHIDDTYCSNPSCQIVNGRCLCADIDHWLKLDSETAKKLGVVALSDQSCRKGMPATRSSRKKRVPF
jgi:hypothetical protein